MSLSHEINEIALLQLYSLVILCNKISIHQGLPANSLKLLNIQPKGKGAQKMRAIKIKTMKIFILVKGNQIFLRHNI